MMKITSLGMVCLLPATAILAAVADYARPDINIAVSGSQTLMITNAEVQVDVASGASATFLGVEKDVFVRVQEGGSAVLNGLRNNTSWHNKVKLWLDASEEWTLEAEKNSSGVVQTFTENGKKGAVIVRWHDRRREQTEWLGYNDRDINPSNTGGQVYPGTMPYVVSNGCNGLNFVSLGSYGSGRRMPFIKKINGVEQHSNGQGGPHDDHSLNAKYVMMVFGSQNGGGNAVVSGKRGTAALFPRKTISDANEAGPSAETPIFSSDRKARLDGIDIEPTKTGLNGGWQVFSFAPRKNVKVGEEYLDELVTGLGWNPWGRYGGQNYAEILIFTEMPTDQEIKSAEHYLAEKWGVATYRTTEEGEVRLYGNGSTTLAAGTVRVGGMFGGTLAVAEDAELVLTDSQMVPSAPASGMSGWYDPSRDDMREILDGEVLKMDTLKNIIGPYNGKPYELMAIGRPPAVISETRGWGASMYWCDYSTQKTGGNGNTLRFDTNVDGVENSMPVRTGFMMLDTRAGGGTPFLDTTVYSDHNTVVSKYVQPRTKGAPIFRTRNDDPSMDGFVTNSPAYLNGVAVDSGKHTFNSRPELLSFSFTQDVPIRCIGAYNQTAGYTPDPEFELRHGEIIFYPTVLSDSDRRNTEAYLMAKWIGVTPTGYGKPGLMTVTGAGNVKTANGKMRPKTDDGFTGRMVILEETLQFTVDATSASPVTDAISISNGELSTPESVTVDLSFPTRPETGKYTLVSAKVWNATTVSLGEVSGPRGVSTASYSVEREGNLLVLTVQRPGMRIIIQ